MNQRVKTTFLGKALWIAVHPLGFKLQLIIFWVLNIQESIVVTQHKVNESEAS